MIYHSLEQMIEGFANVFCKWCSSGKPAGVFRWHQGLGSRGYRVFQYDPSRNSIESQVARGYLVDKSDHPWLIYDAKNNTVSLCAAYQRDRRENIICTHKSQIKKKDLKAYCCKQGLNGQIFQMDDISIVVISGSINSFMQSEFNKKYTENNVDNENEVMTAYENDNVYEQTRKRVAPLLTRAEALYNSDLLNEALIFHTTTLSYRWYESYKLGSKGIYYESLSSDEPDERFIFKEHGYRDIASADELIAFSLAMMCKIIGISPLHLDLQKLEWKLIIANANEGSKELYINNPYYNQETDNNKPLKEQALKDLLE